VLAGQLADARREYHDKLSGLSRDIAIKQAELEQANVKDAITQGLALEGQLMDQAMQLDRLSFDAAKARPITALPRITRRSSASRHCWTATALMPWPMKPSSRPR
jgi:hypothetical protein